MHAPQLIFLFITFIGLGAVSEKHGEKKTGEWNFWKVLLSEIISLSLLYWGGFFN